MKPSIFFCPIDCFIHKLAIPGFHGQCHDVNNQAKEKIEMIVKATAIIQYRHPTTAILANKSLPPNNNRKIPISKIIGKNIVPFLDFQSRTLIFLSIGNWIEDQ